MTDSIIERLRKERRLEISIGDHTFIANRPTDLQAAQFYRDNASNAEVARACVIGWINVKLSDILPGSPDEPLVFSQDLWTEWCADRSEFWTPIKDAVMQAYQTHIESKEASKKN